MADILRRIDPLCATLRDTRNTIKKQLGAQDVQKGTATLAAGTATVSNVRLTANARIVVTRKTPGGTVGDLSAPSASRTAGETNGSFVINSANGADTSTVDWKIVNEYSHIDVSETTVTAADATDLASAITLVNQLRAVYEFHRNDDLAHKAKDSTNAISAAVATDQATAITLANELKADYNAHRSQSGVHHVNDGGNAVSAADATDLTSLQTLVNEIKADTNAHMGTFNAPQNVAPSIRLVDA